MRTTLDLPDPVFRDLKIKAAPDGVSLKELVTSFVEKCLYGPQAPQTKPVRSPLPEPLRRPKGEEPSEPIPLLTNAEMDDIFMQEDLERWGWLPSSKDSSPES